MNILKNIFGGAGGANALSPKEANALINSDQSPLILDVRERSEYNSGHIPNAKLIPLGELPKRMGELPKDRQILCVCASGARSSMATKQLADAGYNVTNLRGGMMAWGMEKFPITKGK